MNNGFGEHIGFGEHEELRKIRIGDQNQFIQAVEVARFANELACRQNTPVEDELGHAWTVIQAARDIVAPPMSELEAAKRSLIEGGGSKDALAKMFQARENADRVPCENLI